MLLDNHAFGLEAGNLRTDCEPSPTGLSDHYYKFTAFLELLLHEANLPFYSGGHAIKSAKCFIPSSPIVAIRIIIVHRPQSHYDIPARL